MTTQTAKAAPTKKFSSSGKKQVHATPSCSGNKEVELTINERFQGEVCCHECGTRFVVEKVRTDDTTRKFFQIPVHRISLELHDLRKRHEQQADR